MSPAFQRSNLDAVGAGALARSVTPTGVRLEAPWPYAPSTPLGQHLRIERLVRVVEGRHLYLANNVDPLWMHKKCWNCGNKFNPGQAQCCTYCNAPLMERRFLASVRHDPSLVSPWRDWMKLRLKHATLIRPSAAFLREGRPVTIYPYHGERLLLDQPAPMPPGILIALLHRIGVGLEALHAEGVRLSRLDASHILIMPDGSARLSDLDVAEVMSPRDLARHPDRPILADVRNLCETMLRFVDPDDQPIVKFLHDGVAGRHGPPKRLRAALEMHSDRLAEDVEDHAHAAYSDLGLTRRRNEDHWGWRRIDDRSIAYVVADGMGGHERGELASELTVKTVLDVLDKGVKAGRTNADYLKQLARQAIEEANRVVLAEAAGQGARAMGATVVLLLMIDDRQGFLAHAGDARAYRLRGGALRPLTSDHSMVQAMVERGKITREEARTHPKANVILNYVGQDPEIDVDVDEVKLLRGDRVLLCSDGLWGELEDGEIEQHLSTWRQTRRAVQRLVRDAYQGGGKDNISLVLVDVS